MITLTSDNIKRLSLYKVKENFCFERMDNFEFMIPILVAIGIAFFLIILRCCGCGSKSTEETDPQQHQQQQHRAMNSREIFSVYPVKHELDSPPSYESVMMSQGTTGTDQQ